MEEWSVPMSEGRKRIDVHMYSPATQSGHLRNITPPTPASSKDRFSQLGVVIGQDDYM